MIVYQQFPGFVIQNPGDRPKITSTPAGRAMGDVPGWRLLLDPAHIDEDNRRAKNLAESDSWANQIFSGGLRTGTFPNGAPSFNPVDGNLLRLVPEGVQINPNAWTVVSVIHAASSPTAQRLVAAENEQEGEVNLRITFSPNAQAVRIEEEVEQTRLSYSMDFTNAPAVLLCTFSTRDGLRIFLNGQEVASNASDKRPLTGGYAAGEWAVFRNSRGHYGMTGLLDIDLGWPEHAGYRRAIERFLVDKYGIG